MITVEWRERYLVTFARKRDLTYERHRL